MVDPLITQIEHCLREADARGELLVAVHLTSAVETLRRVSPDKSASASDVIDLAAHRRRLRPF